MKAPALGPTERLDELGRKGYRIIQDRSAFCFGADAVLLADFAEAKKTDRIADLGTGNGILPLLLDARDKGESIVGLEIQEAAAALARRNFALNGAEERLQVLQGDIREASALLGKAAFDAVVSNPPYMDREHGLANPAAAKAIARHELLCCLEDVIREAAALLRPGGSFFMVHRPRRLTEILCLLRQYRLEPKRLRFVYGSAEAGADMLLIKAVRGGKPFLQVERPLIMYREPGVYTDEVYEMYFGKSRSEGEKQP